MKSYIESGILEMYALGITTPKENEEVMRMQSLYPAIKREIEKITSALCYYLNIHHLYPDPSIKKYVLALINGSK